METPNRKACGLLSDPTLIVLRRLRSEVCDHDFLIPSSCCIYGAYRLEVARRPRQQGTRSLVEGKLLDVLGNFGVYLQACRTGNTLQCAMWYVRVA